VETNIEIDATVNGRQYRREVEPRELLVDFLRSDLRLTGTHSGCDEGACGACTVLVDGVAVKSCLMLAVQVNNASVTTVEGLGCPGKLSPVQQAFVDEKAIQCGYCTPGFVVAATAFLRENPSPADQDIKDNMVGNICRCGCYQNIRKAICSAAESIAQSAAPDEEGTGHDVH
jgi:carbon-monoxide dehydrogenase small subunit